MGEGLQLPHLLLLGEKGVLWRSSQTKTHHPPLDDYRLHWWLLRLMDLTWPWQASSLPRKRVTQHSSEMECAPPSPPQKMNMSQG